VHDVPESAPGAVAATGQGLDHIPHPLAAHTSAACPTRVAGARPASTRNAPQPASSRPDAPASAFAHPLVLLDPRPHSLAFVRSLRARGTPLVVLASHRLEPASYARRVDRHRLPALAAAPERWQARLLELAARLEPRPLLLPCSEPAVRLVRDARSTLEPHFFCANMQPLTDDTARDEPEAALRRAVLRGEAALEVQVTHDASGRRTGMCVLAWAPGAAPYVLVTSVEGRALVERSDAWLRARHHRGYARLVWAPDRFGKLHLQAASTLPGPGLALAVEDGVDLPALAYAAATGAALLPQEARLRLTRRLCLAEAGPTDDVPLVELWPRPSGRDPLPWLVAIGRSLLRS